MTESNLRRVRIIDEFDGRFNYTYEVDKDATVLDLKKRIRSGDAHNPPGPGPSQFMLYQIRSRTDGKKFIYVVKNREKLSTTFCSDSDESTWDINIIIYPRLF